MSPADGGAPIASAEDLRDYVKRAASELEMIRCRVAVVTGALQGEDTGVCQDAAQVLMRDVDDTLCGLVDQAQALVGDPEGEEAPDGE